MDPPFSWEPLQVIPWIDEAVRICKTDGNIAIFNHPKTLISQLAEIERRSRSNVGKYNIYKGLELRDWITVQHNSAKPKLNSLSTRTMAIAIISKSSNRKIYVDKLQSLTCVYDPEGKGLITDHWIDIHHKPGHHGKFKILAFDQNFKHNTATAEWVMERLLNCFSQPGDVVYDCFGGSGTVPYLCEEYGIECRSVELDSIHFTIMVERLLQSQPKNRNFASYAKKATDKINELRSRTINRVGTSLQGSPENRREIVGSGTETVGKMG